ncbi:MAG: uroporphyrinogen decarboxylase family protein [Planctomycetota bacterium]
MSYEDGWAAINLEMPKRVPRTEYSLERHWEALAAITGIDVTIDSPGEVKSEAARELWRIWNYDFFWCTSVGSEAFGKWKTDMGHAVYAAGGVDYREIGTCPFETPEEVLEFDPREEFDKLDHAELVKKFQKSYKSQCESWPDGVHMVGTYTTCISGLIDMLGWDMLLLAAGVDQKKFGEMTNRYCEWFQQYMNALADADVPLVMIHDDMVWTAGPFIHPDWYRKFVFPNFKRYFAPIRESGKKIMFTSDGDYTEFIDDLVEAGVTGFVMEPMTDMACIAEKYGKTHSFVGNADTRILLLGSRAEIRAEVERCMDIGKGCPGFFMAVGNHIPPNTPVDSILYYNEVYEELSKR